MITNPIRRRTVLRFGIVLLGLQARARADDAALLRELRAGAVVLMRHTQTTPVVGDPPGWLREKRWWCAAALAPARRCVYSAGW